MPVISKKQLRRTLAQRYIHDFPPVVLPQKANLGFGYATPIAVYSPALADIGATGQNLYQGAWIYVEGSTPSSDQALNFYQYLVASYNCGSGAFITTALSVDSVGTNSYWELHTRVPPYDKDNAIDETIKRLRIRQEVALNTIDGALFYALDGVASPYALDKILDVHVFANPTGTQDRNTRHVDDWQVVTGATGPELRLLHALQGSQQFVFDAILIPTLGGELATINIPDERWILSGAAARCYDFMMQNAPAQQVALLQQRRQEHATEFSRLTTRFAPVIDKPIRLNDVVSGRGGQYPDNSSGWW